MRDLMITPRRWTSMFTGWGAIRGLRRGRFNAVSPEALPEPLEAVTKAQVRGVFRNR
ncbi:hypothetical protein Apa02nite_081340 [Actinoplanes palleronii]|uniref:Uncharacterized protein n=1 Tax=Actinoplanes palleronii TaxID=113570 RepID=A0ABQ4BP24_9ACTN|nr:hypothetical protein Apa02nite_081340 [Actinoplanes palleronii]